MDDVFWRGFTVVAGVFFLYIVEQILEVAGLGHAHSHDITPVQGAGMRRQSRHIMAEIQYVVCSPSLSHSLFFRPRAPCPRLSSFGSTAPPAAPALLCDIRKYGESPPSFSRSISFVG